MDPLESFWCLNGRRMPLEVQAICPVIMPEPRFYNVEYNTCRDTRFQITTVLLLFIRSLAWDFGSEWPM